MKPKQPDLRLWPWIAFVALAGLAVLALGASQPTSEELSLLLMLMVLGALAERYAVGLFDSHVSVGVVAVLAAAVVGGTWGVALVAPPIVLAGDLGSDSAWYKRLYNVATYLLAGAAFAGVFQAFGHRARPDDWPEVLAPALLGALANFAINSVLVAAAIALSARQPLLAAWRQRYQWLLPQYLVVGLAAMALATAYHVLGLWGLAVFAAPVAGIRHAFFLGAKAVTARLGFDQERARAA
ncbi:MAG: hypothetical protein A2148_01785 [Chloroflexi bacterium RBG_16_68_14]|nr:MAG: hypothetical protein A2148_01785 [Chloroflexi bacterium RBG_16_68_14]